MFDPLPIDLCMQLRGGGEEGENEREEGERKFLFLVVCITYQQHASIYQGRVWSDSCSCCYTEITVVNPTCYLTQSQYTDTGLTSPSADPITPGAC